MGLGIGIECERCGGQIGYDSMPFETKQGGYENDLCGTCINDRKKKEWDNEHPLT